MIARLLVLLFVGTLFCGCQKDSMQTEVQVEPEQPVQLVAFPAEKEKTQDWEEIILSEPQGKVPAPLPGEVVWRTDFQQALQEARETNRPLLVTWRCLPCKQCAEFDKIVLEGTPKLTPVLRQFITLRMTDASELDTRYFPFLTHQDLDVSWWCYLMSPRGELYSIFGGKDHVSDKTRISELSFLNTLNWVLAHHYDPRRADWQVDGPVPDLSQPAYGPKNLPGFESSFARHEGWAKQECIHCHQVNEIIREESLVNGTFNKETDLQPWPFPENVGLLLELDHGLKVSKVSPGSPAARAGLKTGDVLAVAEGQKLFGQADFRGVLHRGPLGDGEISIQYQRNGKLQSAVLKVQNGWRKTDISWRKSVYDGNIGMYPTFFPLHGPGFGKGKMSFKPFIGKNTESPAYQAGLRPDHEIVEVDGYSKDCNSREFLTWFRLNHNPGDKVTLKVKEGNRVRTISYTLPMK